MFFLCIEFVKCVFVKKLYVLPQCVIKSSALSAVHMPMTPNCALNCCIDNTACFLKPPAGQSPSRDKVQVGFFPVIQSIVFYSSSFLFFFFYHQMRMIVSEIRSCWFYTLSDTYKKEAREHARARTDTHTNTHAPCKDPLLGYY